MVLHFTIPSSPLLFPFPCQHNPKLQPLYHALAIPSRLGATGLSWGILSSITYDIKVIQMAFVSAKVAWVTLRLVDSANCKFRALSRSQAPGGVGQGHRVKPARGGLAPSLTGQAPPAGTRRLGWPLAQRFLRARASQFQLRKAYLFG